MDDKIEAIMKVWEKIEERLTALEVEIKKILEVRSNVEKKEAYDAAMGELLLEFGAKGTIGGVKVVAGSLPAGPAGPARPGKKKSNVVPLKGDPFKKV